LFWLLEAKTISRTQIIVSTFATISVDKKNINLISEGFDIMKDIEISISSYNPKARVYLLNKNLHVENDGYLFEALSLCKNYYEITDGYFDITVGSITKDLYRFGESERVPTQRELKDAKVGFGDLRFTEKEVFIDNGVKVDFGGMGKGFAVDKVAEYFRSKGVAEAVISLSGDIRCLSTCKIDIQNPFVEDERMVSFESAKSDLGITTSGNYNRYVESTQNNHLIDPKAKKPQTLFISITLIGELSSSDLDAYATAASVMPTKKAYEFLDSLGVGYIVMQSDEEIVISKNIAKYAKNLLFSDTLKKQPRDIEN
jgi:thiamine biosynthesis lipoprotein